MNKPIFRTALISLVAFSAFLPLAESTAVALGTPVNASAGSTFEQRVAQRKQEQNEQLDTQTQQHIQGICITEQASIRNLQSKATDLVNKRNAAYQQIDGFTLVSIGQLKLASQDTFTLEKSRVTMVQKMTDFLTTAGNYQQTLGDLLTVDCKADVVGFQSLLDTARAYQAELKTQSQETASYITDTIIPALQTFGAQLQAKSSTGGL